MTTSLRCRCGETRLELDGEPITVAECCCDSCREAAGRMERLDGASTLLTSYGATRCAEVRKDRVRFLSGREHLREFRLRQEAGTRRVVATCCNTPVFVEAGGAHWVGLYARLWPEDGLPPVDVRMMTGDLRDPSMLPDDGARNLKTRSVSFYTKLFGAWVAMGFRNPEITVKGAIDV